MNYFTYLIDVAKVSSINDIYKYFLCFFLKKVLFRLWYKKSLQLIRRINLTVDYGRWEGVRAYINPSRGYRAAFGRIAWRLLSLVRKACFGGVRACIIAF